MTLGKYDIPSASQPVLPGAACHQDNTEPSLAQNDTSWCRCVIKPHSFIHSCIPCLDHRSPAPSPVDKYISDLREYHTTHNHQHATDFSEEEEHVGYQRAALRKVGEPENIFDPIPQADKDRGEPRCVAVIGVPGAGKNLTSYYVVKQVCQKMMPSSIRFVFLIILVYDLHVNLQLIKVAL